MILNCNFISLKTGYCRDRNYSPRKQSFTEMAKGKSPEKKDHRVSAKRGKNVSKDAAKRKWRKKRKEKGKKKCMVGCPIINGRLATICRKKKRKGPSKKAGFENQTTLKLPRSITERRFN